MSNPPTSERDSLIQAIELAQQEITHAQQAQKEAEGKIAALQVRMDRQYTKFVFVHSQLEKLGIESPWEEDQDGRIKTLEAEYEQILAENQRLVGLLLADAQEDESKAAPGSLTTPVRQGEPAAPGSPSVEIEASPRHERRLRT